MNKEYTVNPDGTMIVHEEKGEKRELTTNSYEILQTENTIEKLEDLLEDEKEHQLVSKNDKKLLFILCGILILMAGLGLGDLIGVNILNDIFTFVSVCLLSFELLLGTVFGILGFKYSSKAIKISNALIEDYSKELEEAKERLENLRVNAVKLTPEEAKELAANGPFEVAEDERISQLRRKLEIKKEVLSKFKRYRRLYENRMLIKSLANYSKEEQNMFLEEVISQIRERKLNSR